MGNAVPTSIHAQLTSDDGMVAATWGPPLWFFLHAWSANAPLTGDDPAAVRRSAAFIDGLGAWLPCGPCRRNYVGNLTEALRATQGALEDPRSDLLDTARRLRAPVSAPCAAGSAVAGVVSRGRIVTMYLVFQLHHAVTRHLGRPRYPVSFYDHVRRTVADRARGGCRGQTGCHGSRSTRVKHRLN